MTGTQARNKGLLLGSHVPIAKGVHQAPARGAATGCTAIQIFVKNNNRWHGPPITDIQARAFPQELEKAGITPQAVVAHTAYLINLATTRSEVLEKSIDALEDELLRCAQIGVPGLVMHPGAHLGQGVEAGIAQIAMQVRKIYRKHPEMPVRLLFENTAGAGSTIGVTFEELAALLEAVKLPDKTGVCLDTCHLFAAGYDLRTREAYEQTMADFDRTVGFDRLFAVHLNDSKGDLGSNKDRHEHIGKGKLGVEPFRLLLNDARFRGRPMVLETEFGPTMAEITENLGVLLSLVED